MDNFEEKYKGLTDEDLREADDRIILIGNGTTEAEVTYNELDYVQIKKQLWGIVYTIKEHDYRSQSFQKTYPTKEEAQANMYKDIMADYKAADSIQELKSLIDQFFYLLFTQYIQIIAYAVENALCQFDCCLVLISRTNKDAQQFGIG